MQQNKQQVQPVKTKKRSLRKSEPTIDDYAKAYALMAEAERQQQEEERRIAEIEMQSAEDDNATVEVIQQVVETGPAEEEEADANQIFTVVEQEPEFPGGTKALMEYISKNLRYPAFAAENGIQGRVTLSFVVEKDGSVTDIQELRSPSEDLTKEAKRVVQSMPKWKPGKQRGKPVRVKYMLPVTFRLQ